MLTKTKIIIVLTGLLLSGSIAIFAAWLESHDDRVRMQATVSEQKTIVESLQRQMQTIQDEESKREAAAASALAAMRQAVAKIRTPQQIAEWLPKQVQLPAPVTLSIPAAAPQDALPDATATIPQQDLAPIKTAVEGCKECALNVASLRQDLAGKQQQLKLAGEELSATERERDAAIAASKGGNVWIRLRRGAKWFAVGAGVALGALCSSGHCK
ncbi:MAG: hypothetical protein WBZ32_09835 [Candidatus Acidiferrales bacterium]